VRGDDRTRRDRHLRCACQRLVGTWADGAQVADYYCMASTGQMKACERMTAASKKGTSGFETGGRGSEDSLHGATSRKTSK
jgi:hypothetical protein